MGCTAMVLVVVGTHKRIGSSVKEQNEKRLTDVTEFRYRTSGKVYLCAVLDLYGKNIASFLLGKRNTMTLVFEAFKRAFQ